MVRQDGSGVRGAARNVSTTMRQPVC
jgi:hypothetical protein